MMRPEINDLRLQPMLSLDEAGVYIRQPRINWLIDACIKQLEVDKIGSRPLELIISDDNATVIGHTHIFALANAIVNSRQTIKSIEFDSCLIDVDGWNALGNAFLRANKHATRYHATLKIIDCGHFGNNHLAALAPFLAANRTLARVALQRTSVDCEGM